MLTYAEESPLLHLQCDAATNVFVAVDGKVVGLITLTDTIKTDARQVIANARQRGLACALLTGDQLPVAQAVAQAVGITDIHAGLMPSDKMARIQQWQQQQQRVAMIGDGMNDAPALSGADIRIAMATTDAANAIAYGAGDVVVLSGRVDGVLAVIDLSKATLRTIKQNLAGAFIYNILALPIAAGVLYPLTGLLLNPMIAAIAMAASSLTVVGNSLRLGRKFQYGSSRNVTSNASSQDLTNNPGSGAPVS
jgi:Cu+-exporting ATPase